jgi:hypothetical protein
MVKLKLAFMRIVNESDKNVANKRLKVNDSLRKLFCELSNLISKRTKSSFEMIFHRSERNVAGFKQRQNRRFNLSLRSIRLISSC